jgi:phosphinothricin acetyltransferase
MDTRPQPNDAGSNQQELPAGVRIRHATMDDLERIVEIYNESIPGGWSTADTRPIKVSDRVDWFKSFDRSKRPIWVAEFRKRVVATTYLTSFYQGRPAYDGTAEISIYISNSFQRCGLGKVLKKWVIDQCPKLGITTLLSMHFDHNEATRRINAQFGFEQMGHLPDIAIINGVSRGLIISGLRIPPELGDSVNE